MNTKYFKIKLGLILLTAFGTFIFFFSKPVMTQKPEYHSFIDSRSFMGIPNAMDVLSNVGFVLVGLLGLFEISRMLLLKTRRSWKWLFLSILLVAPGSAYYHWSPNDATLIWDRLPMSMGFMALYIILLAEHITLSIEKYLYPALLLGISSVLVWVITTDLRFYFWIQFSSFITIPIILGLFPSRYTMKSWYLLALAFYGLAKWAEVRDKEIYQITGEFISGHSVKHILAAIGLMALWWMVKFRKDKSATISHGRIADAATSFEQAT